VDFVRRLVVDELLRRVDKPVCRPLLLGTWSSFAICLDIRMTETLVSIREGPNTAQRSHTLDTIPATQDLDVDLEVVLVHVSVSVGHLPSCHMMIKSIPTLLLCPCIPLLGLILLSLMTFLLLPYL